jgi:hypothetical protein
MLHVRPDKHYKLQSRHCFRPILMTLLLHYASISVTTFCFHVTSHVPLYADYLEVLPVTQAIKRWRVSCLLNYKSQSGLSIWKVGPRKPQSVYSVFRPRFEPDAFRTQVRNFTAWASWLGTLPIIDVRKVQVNLSLYLTNGCKRYRSGFGAVLHEGRSRVRLQMRSLNYFNLPNPSSRIRPWGLLSF